MIMITSIGTGLLEAFSSQSKVIKANAERDYTACLHDQNKSGFFGGPAFIQPIRAI